MSDIVEQLHNVQAALEDERKAHQVCVEMRNDAEKQIERLLAMLDWIEIYEPDWVEDAEKKFGPRRALEEEKP